MLYNGKNGRICGADYIRFGTGKRNLVILPGLGDGLRTVQGTALPMAWMYRIFARDFTVYMFSRKDELPASYSTREMARDLKDAMGALGIEKADILGVSMGGMIAQWLAVDHPEKVNKLILTVTSARPNEVLTSSLNEWMDQARRGDHGALMDSNMRKIYSAAYYRKNKWMIPLVAVLTKPKSYARFLTLSEACLAHDAFNSLKEISCPAFVVGGEKDEALGGDASGELAAEIPDAELKMYSQWGHGLYEEAKDFNRLVLDYLMK